MTWSRPATAAQRLRASSPLADVLPRLELAGSERRQDLPENLGAQVFPRLLGAGLLRLEDDVEEIAAALLEKAKLGALDGPAGEIFAVELAIPALAGPAQSLQFLAHRSQRAHALEVDGLHRADPCGAHP